MKTTLLLVGLCHLLGLGITLVAADAFNDDHRLITDLFNSSTYVTDVFPRKNNSHTMRVDFGLAAVGVDLDELNKILHIHAWLKMVWKDPRLAWDPAKYGGVKVLRASDRRVWKPDIELYNSAEDSRLFPQDNHIHVVIYSDGTVLWIPTRELQAKCAMDLRRFPFDSHTCALKFGSWTFDGFKIDLDFYEGRRAIDMNDFVQHSEWDVTKTLGEKSVRYYPCCTEPYPSLQFNITFKRRATYYSNIFIGPAVVMAMLIPLTFLMPSESGEKVTLGGAIMICLILMVLLLENYLPSALSTASLIAMYYTSSFIMMGVSLALSALTSNLSRWQSQPPAALSQIMIGCFGRILCVNPTTHSSVKEHDDPGNKGQADEVRMVEPRKVVNEWRVISIVMDRLLAVVFLVAVVILTIAIFA
ncbi:neuronal acetylcholine receptor subunit alpha-7-like [Lineus longissimus]|uniref:neuronal acetylcholine receptor subunit alpha-7-like n=1 Tax=Lineus longissimus TaxID=88925 RepID=UPI002B4ED978